MPHRTERRRGTSLVEVVVAVAILALAAVVSFEVLGTARKAQASTEGRTSAVFLARSLLEEARATDFDALASRSGSTAEAGLSHGQASSRIYSYVVNVDTPASNLKRIRVTVTWTAGRTSSSFVLESSLCRV